MKENKDKSEIFKNIIENNKSFGISEDLINKLELFSDKAKENMSQLNSKSNLKPQNQMDSLLEKEANSEIISETVYNHLYENDLNGKIFSSHEGLLLKYEECFVRKIDDKFYNLSADFLWIGKFLKATLFYF
jgi:hypothetical protein